MTTLATAQQHSNNHNQTHPQGPSTSSTLPSHGLSNSGGSQFNDERSIAQSSDSYREEAGGGLGEKTFQDEKDFITAYEQRHSVLPPDEIAQDPKNKLLGSSSKNLSVHDFELMRTVGTGTFARVWLARFANSKQEDKDKVFALKVLRKVDVIKLKQVEHVRNERNTLALVAGHPFITTMITSFSDDHSLYMLQNYTPGGEIFSYLRRARRFPERPHAVIYAAEIVLILDFLHSVHGIAYRDLKPENILLDAEGHLKLVDFGFAKQIYDRETYTLCGTPEYLAPEVIKNSGHGQAVDWWALGILIYEFIVGQPPFWDQNPMRIYEQIVEGHIRFPPSSNTTNTTTSSSASRRNPPIPISAAAKDIILSLCRVDPTERLGHIAGGAQRVKDHDFFRGVDWDALYERRCGKGPIVPRVEWAGDAGNFDEYPDPPADDHEHSGGGGKHGYTWEMREVWEHAFQDF